MARGRDPLRIGTAGWAIPRGVADAFAGSGAQIQRYASVMNAVEINSSFHRPHRRTTYERWASSTPSGFQFSVKLPKTITHGARLVGTDDALATFAEQVLGLGDKLAVVLIQLPPSLDFDETVASAFFMDARARLGEHIDVACEPRHRSWFTAAANALMQGHRIARVAADPAPVPAGAEPGGWRGLCYLRLHGSPRVYWSSYEAPELDRVAKVIGDCLTEDARTWCVFDNTASGAALNDALALRALLASQGAEL